MSHKPFVARLALSALLCSVAVYAQQKSLLKAMRKPQAFHTADRKAPLAIDRFVNNAAQSHVLTRVSASRKTC